MRNLLLFFLLLLAILSFMPRSAPFSAGSERVKVIAHGDRVLLVGRSGTLELKLDKSFEDCTKLIDAGRITGLEIRQGGCIVYFDDGSSTMINTELCLAIAVKFGKELYIDKNLLKPGKIPELV